MNNRQKEAKQAQLDAEKAVLKQLETQYKKALDDINERIKVLQSDELTASRIYRIEHQKALKGQVSAILDKLHADEYGTISQFLSETYTDAFVYTAYDLFGQGVPLILPIDPKDAVRAIKLDSKISSDLYTALGVDTTKLKQSISAEISRGLASGMPYSDIARNISATTKAPLNRANTIVATEAHRIQEAAAYDVHKKAKSKGADIVRQWNSTLDGKTRSAHRRMDGQIVEVDEPFVMGGQKAMYPGEFGDPAQDCNCRCTVLQRARWALGADELKTLQQRAEFFGLDKTENLKDFKKKYLTASEAQNNENVKKTLEKLPKNGIITVSSSVLAKDANSSPRADNTQPAPTVAVDPATVYQEAKDNSRHGGVYRDAMKKSEARLLKSIKSHEEQVALHADKISNPEKYDKGWGSKSQQEKDGLLKKWRKDMQRNAEQAAIEREVYKERFGEDP